MPPFLIDEAILKQLVGRPADALRPRDAAEIALRLRGLARWWLRPEVLRVSSQAPVGAAIERDWCTLPALPGGPGDCWVLFALPKPMQAEMPALRPALVLPLRWRRDAPTSPFLPPALREVADQVLETLRGEAEKHGLDLRQSTWGLHPGPWNDGLPIDLSRLDRITCRSAWAALAGGLILAAAAPGEARPDPSVWATGSWESTKGIQSVDLLPEKLALAREWGARLLFVPGCQVKEARTLLGDAPMELGALRANVPSAWEALAEYRDRLDAPPGPDDPVPRRSRYYLRRSDPQRAEDYYASNLLPELIAFHRRQVEDRWPDCRFAHLVTLISDGAPELVPIAVGALRPRHVWLLHTSDAKMTGIKDRVSARLESLRGHGVPDHVQLHPLAFDDEERLRVELPDRLRQLDPIPGPRLLDVTLGTKLMSLVLDTLARPGPEPDLVLYWSHHRQGPCVLPGSQRLLYRDPSSSWTPLGPSLIPPRP